MGNRKMGQNYCSSYIQCCLMGLISHNSKLRITLDPKVTSCHTEFGSAPHTHSLSLSFSLTPSLTYQLTINNCIKAISLSLLSSCSCALVEHALDK